MVMVTTASVKISLSMTASVVSVMIKMAQPVKNQTADTAEDAVCVLGAAADKNFSQLPGDCLLAVTT